MINKGRVVLYVSLVVFMLVPTVLVYKKMAFAVLFIGGVLYLHKSSRIYFSKEVSLLLLFLLFPVFSALVFYALERKGEIQSLIYLVLTTIPVYIFVYKASSLEHWDEFITVFLFISTILAFLLIFEAFRGNIYYLYLNISPIDNELAKIAFNMNTNLNKFNVYDLYLKRAYGPFRYQLIAGYSLMLGFFLLLYCAERKFTPSILFFLVVHLLGMVVTSKGVLIASLVIGGVLFLSSISSVLIRLFLMVVGGGGVAILVLNTVIMPIISGLGVGSFLKRLDRVNVAFQTFLSQEWYVVLFGHGLGFTWYGNSEYVEKYAGAEADIGMYMSYLLQGGVFSIIFAIFFVWYISHAKRRSVDRVSIYLFSYIQATVLVWLTISNMDIVFWLFFVLGIIASRRRFFTLGSSK